VKNKRRKSVWKISGVIAFIDALIFNGDLKKDGYDVAYKKLREKFAEKLKRYNFNKTMFRRKVNERIWTDAILSQMRDAIRYHLNMDDAYKHFSFIPYGQFVYKWNQLKGKSAKAKHTGFVRGVGRIAKEISSFSPKPYEFPENNFEHPIDVGKSVVFLNGVNLGIPHSRVIDENPARQALINAELNGDPSVILTNFIDLRFKKASGSALRVYRALTSGRNINPDVFDEDYAEEVRKILANDKDERIIYQTTAELFVDSLYGWLKIVGSGKPIYSGNIYIVLGYKEEAMIAAAAYSEVHYFWQKELNRLQLMRKALLYRLSKARKNELPETEEIETKLHKLEEEIARKRAISNVSDRDFQAYFNRVLAFVVSKIEKTIPNSKVIGIGSQYIRLHDGVVKVHIPNHIRPTDRLLADYCNNYTDEVLSEKLPNAVVICHPYALGYKYTMRENDKDGRRGDSGIFVAPIVVDERRIADVLKKTIRTIPGISKATSSKQFKAGMLRLVSTSGTIQPEVWSISALGKRAKLHKKAHGKKIKAESYIWIMVGTDPHWGSSTKQFVFTEDGRRLDVVGAIIELMRRDNLFDGNKIPIHMFVLNDDPTQGHNFNTQQRPHVNKMPYIDLETLMREQIELAEKSQNVEDVRNILKNIREIALNQVMLRAEHWTQDQMKMVLDHFIEPNVDFFDAVLRRALSANITVRGISEIGGNIYDARDPGIINIGTGNHFAKSVDYELTEGFIYVRVLRALLMRSGRWSSNGSILKRLVKAPLYSNQFVAFGTVGVSEKYEWGIDWRDAPARMSGWGDPLLGWVRVDLRRGNYGRHMNGKVTVKICGDKHFGAETMTPWALYVMGMPGTVTDQYAEMGGAFPPNNTGVSFIGLPVDGPNNAPILTRSISFARIVKMLEDNEFIDWETFFVNPA